MSGPIKPAKPAPLRDWRKAADSIYTFATLRSLPHLPHHETSLRFLERLRDDPGVRHVMRKHKYAVGLLLEMEPAGNTTHEGKTLGLNRNNGEVIEVRLRTDWYDGWRDYKTVRKTLMHELAHIEFSDHDRDFWNLTNLLEKECAEADWTTGGRALTNQVFYSPPERETQTQDAAGWRGGEFRLGGGGTVKGSATGTEVPVGKELSRREIMAKAAEERMKKLAAASAAASSASAGEGSSSSSSSSSSSAAAVTAAAAKK